MLCASLSGSIVMRGNIESMKSKWFTSLISGFALIGVTLTSAFPAPAAEQAPDKSGPGVARVSILQGSAVVQRGDSNKQVAATVNAPLLPGDYISTGATSRAEVHLDGFSAVRLGGDVQARIITNDPNNLQLQLADCTVVLGVVHEGDAVSIETPSVTVRARQVGDYRVSIGKDGSTWGTTRRGSAEVVPPQRSYTLESGRTLVARGSASDPAITYTSEIGYDSFDDFNAKRDETMVAAIGSSPNLNPDIAGYDNLGAYGQWQNVPGYGQSWVPDQSANWSPYSDGSWTWEGGYGWTWVGNEPWGWAPYHYGRWYYANNYGWAWYPPAYTGYASWSPALVGFFGFGVGGAGWGLNVGFGYPNIGWYPLAPYAPFYPWDPGWAWTGYGLGLARMGLGRRLGRLLRLGNAHRERHEDHEHLSELPARRRARHHDRKLPSRNDRGAHLRGERTQHRRPRRRDSRCRAGNADSREPQFRPRNGAGAGNALEVVRLAAVRVEPRSQRPNVVRPAAACGLAGDLEPGAARKCAGESQRSGQRAA